MNKNIINSSLRMEDVHSDIRGPLYQEALRMQAQGTPVLRLNTGNPAAFGFTMPDSVRNALLNNADKAVGYCDSKGMKEAREAILAYHTKKGFQNIGLDDIFIGNGVSEIAQMITLAALNPGDEILLPSPNYSLWSNCTYLAGARPVFYRCDEQQDWFPDAADIKAKITSRTRAILLINPNNPTGAVYSKELLLEVLEIARQHNLLVLSDEIYDRLVYDGHTHISTAALAPDLDVVTFNGLSKSHLICGFRCGWMVFSGKSKGLLSIRDAVERIASMRLCGNALTQLVIPAALDDEMSTRAMLQPGGRLYEQRKAVLDVLKNADGFSAVPNNAAFYLFPKFDAKRFGVTDDREFGMGLLKAKHVLIVPGSGFDFPEPDHFRLVMLPEPKQLGEATQKMVDYLHSLEK